jgi:hypothetical protein
MIWPPNFLLDKAKVIFDIRAVCPEPAVLDSKKPQVDSLDLPHATVETPS